MIPWPADTKIKRRPPWAAWVLAICGAVGVAACLLAVMVAILLFGA